MIRIYASRFSRSRRALWVCEEAGAPYEVVELPWPPRSSPGYLDISPAGVVPAIQDGDVTLSESLAICEYVARRHRPELIVEPDQPDYFAYLQLLHFGESTLQPPLVWARRFGPLAEQALADARDAFTLRLSAIERTLADGREWLVRDRFTCADLSVGFPLILARRLGLGDLIPPLTQAYRDRLRARPACERAYAR
jgi:glutathione S-transferase